MSTRVKCIMFLFLLVVLRPLFVNSQSTVYVKNAVEGNLKLTIHCKSKDEDLGAVTLNPNQSYRFVVFPKFFGGTLYFCTFRWPGSCHWFDIYVESRDLKICYDDHPTACNWIIKKAGPCQNSPLSNQCFKWNPDTCVP
ncbi:hypothetical protein HN873_047334 [Arachis hypogaea]|nr:Self-incomp_S1 domain-containing protein [Arachis hypogaea]